MNHAVSVPVTDSTCVAQARRAAIDVAHSLNFSVERAGRVAIVCTELASNIVKHAASGEMVITQVQNSHQRSVELLALDKGPGMENVAECLRDGYSTAGSAGTGLGAIQRLSDSLDLFTRTGAGTAIAARLSSDPPAKMPSPPPRIDVAGFSLAMKGEDVSGDAWLARSSPSGCTILVADGLGHGVIAFEAAKSAIDAFECAPEDGPVELLNRVHGALRSTRGAAGAIAQVDVNAAKIRYVGIGNIASSIIGFERSHSLVSMNGILGHEIRTLREFSYAWPPGGTLVLCSDGISTHVNLADYPGLLRRSCAVIAGVIYRDYYRGRDDATVVVAQERSRW
jgi:anti-sigma regulatory factor (Ser/Thr protein kinase)